jgi:anti-sigma B factor antagonist
MLKITVEESDKTVIFVIEGKLTLISMKEFENLFNKYINSDMTVVALDLKNMPYMDSFGISRFVKIGRAFRGGSTEFVLINMNDHIQQIFRMSTFDRIFKIMTSDEFKDKYFQTNKTAEPGDSDNIIEGSKSGDLKNGKKIQHFVIDDKDGTTLIFVDD